MAMFPSGRWAGYWEQSLWGRQPMTEFTLVFDPDGTIRGEGRDVIGAFTFTGTWDRRGTVRMVKQYIKKHRVLYEGVHQGEGLIAGRWSIGEHWYGPFALQPVSARADPDAPVADIN
jgi:hypothetical protein